MRTQTTPPGTKDIAALAPGEYEVEFVREQKRIVAQESGTSEKAVAAMADAQRRLSACILRIVATGEEIEDTSRATAGSPPGTRFLAMVTEGVRYAAFKPKVPLAKAEHG